MLLIISDYTTQALEGSVFDDYGTMMLVRILGGFIVAVLILLLIFIPLYTVLWKFLRRKFPGKGTNLGLKGYKLDLQNRNDYKEYKAWAAKNGYEPIIPYQPFLKKATKYERP